MDLKTRVVNILTKPGEEWPVVAAESIDSETLTRSYTAVLAAIPAVASFIGTTLVGVWMPLLGTIRVGVVHGFTNAVVQYALTIVGVYVAAMVIDRLAPTFKSQSSAIQALKLVAYASTPAWLAGILHIIPVLAPLSILAGLYAIYLFYLGMKPMMKTPDDQVIPYMIVAAVIVIVVMFVVSVCASAITGIFF